MQFSYNKLSGKIKEVFDTQAKFAKSLGISRSALSLRLHNHAEFSQSEILNACKLLSIEKDKIIYYFFTPRD